MFAILVAFLVSGGLRLILAGCPFQQALENGQISASLYDKQKHQLINEKYLLNDGQPASVFWQSETLTDETLQRFKRSTNLLLAKQFYVQQTLVDDPHDQQHKDDLLRSAASCLPEHYRCDPVPECDVDYRYVISEGLCNNLRHPKWGAAYTAYGRLAPPVYDDGIHTIRRSVTNGELPSPRLVGNYINQIDSFHRTPATVLNYGSVMFGQYIAHDMGLRNVFQNKHGGPGLSCCPRDQSHMPPQHLRYYGCDPIEIPADDPFFGPFGNKRCMTFVRSQPIMANDCSMDSTEISNSVSHFVDQSNIYGSDDASEKSVRTYRGGRLKITHEVAAHPTNCTGNLCYFSGDTRAMINPTLGLWHSVFMRFHNHIASRLAAFTEQRSDEALFQQTRRILSAVYQNVVFNEWLPLYVGADVAARRSVSCLAGGQCRGRYNPQLDPSTLNEFSVGAFRMFHMNLPRQTNLYDKRYKLKHSYKLNDTIMGSKILETHYEDMLRGLLKDPLRAGKFPDYMRNEIFNNENPDGIGMDILAVDIARGRDHGLSPYHVYLTKSTNGRHVVTTWKDLDDFMSDSSIAVLQQIYACALDVDLLVGLLLEEKKGVYAGPVAQYIIEEQFYRAKFGNRFFYSLEDNPNPFTDDQLSEINDQSFASILCAVTNLEEVNVHAFEVGSISNPRVRCDSFKPLDLKRCSSKS